MATKKIQIINGASIIPQSDWNQTDETKSDYIKNKPKISDEDAVKMVRTSAADNENVVGKRIFMLDESNKDTLHATLKTMYSQTDQYLVFIKTGGYYYHAQSRKSGKYLYLQYEYCDSNGLFKTRLYKWNSEGTSEDSLTITDKSNYAESELWYDDAYYFTTPPTVQAVDKKLTEKQDKAITDEGAYFNSDTVEGALQELGEALDKFTYVSPTVTLAVGANSIEELGKVLSSVTVSATANKECKSLKLYSGSTLLQSAENATSVSATVENVSATTTFKAVATDKYDKNIQKTSTISFYNGVYYGVASDGVSISELTKKLQGNNNCEFSGNAGVGQYFFFASPKRYGTPSFKDKDTGFGADFTLVNGNVAFTNASGYEETYQLYRSTHPALGQTTITVY